MAGQIEWAMWANEQAYVSVVFLFMGAIIGVAGDFINWQFAACVIPECLILFFLEYPRSKRVKGSTIERKYQIYLTKALNAIRPVSSNYYIRCILHTIFAIPCCFLLPTIMGGLGLLMAAIIYLVAAIQGEEWKPANLPSTQSQTNQQQAGGIPDAPKKPPPRRPVQGHDNVAAGDIEMQFN